MSKVNPWNDQLAMYMLSIGVIEVDEEGRIWKLKDGRTKKHVWNNVTPRRMEVLNKNGYFIITFIFNKKLYALYAHRIVWFFHYGLIPDGLEVNHKNGVKNDNRPYNLELMTPSENIKHGYDVIHHGTNHYRGETSPNAKLTEQDVRDIRALYAKGGISQREIGERYGLTQTAVGFIVRRVNWAHVV